MQSFSSTSRVTAQIDSRLSLDDVGQARPPRGDGAPSRTRSHYARILALLRARGPAGVTSSELYDQPHLYGRSPRNRISELRAAGNLIRTIPAGASVVRYVLTHENPSPVERPALHVVPKSFTTTHTPQWDGHQLVMFDLTVQQ